MIKKKISKIKPQLPLYCDFACEHSAFAPEDSTGACRREQAVYCKLVGKFNNKNAKCLVSNNTTFKQGVK